MSVNVKVWWQYIVSSFPVQSMPAETVMTPVNVRTKLLMQSALTSLSLYVHVISTSHPAASVARQQSPLTVGEPLATTEVSPRQPNSTSLGQ